MHTNPRRATNNQQIEHGIRRTQPHPCQVAGASRADFPARADGPSGRDPRSIAPVGARFAAGDQHCAFDRHPGHHDLCKEPAGVCGLSIVAAGRNAVSAGAERRDHTPDSHRRRRRCIAGGGATCRGRGHSRVQQFCYERQPGSRADYLRHHFRHSVRRYHQGRDAHQ